MRAAQWALDGRKELPTFGEFRTTLAAIALEMVDGARELKRAVVERGQPSSVHVINRTSSGLEDDTCLAALPAPRLILTSPPYPGVHVLYHRWQVDGRKEAPLPFMIADKLDGAGSSYYTMGDRRFPKLQTYFDGIRAAMRSAAAIADDQTIVVQMVAFADPSWQLPKYIETMAEAGLSEMFLPSLVGRNDGRLWRTVPNRRWYSQQRGETAGSLEVVLFHRRADASSQPLTQAHLRPRLGTDLRGQATSARE